MKSILITGCNRGIGYGLVKHLKEKYQNVNHIFATYRNPDTAQVWLKKFSFFDKNVNDKPWMMKLFV